ncbi:helix-turn-helix transcriptional regulator [uncultured Thermomonospora sp.]|uniref:helix-turn-helix domain-containing protein n=1 Tax=uncultured Thermomonospora sp. TaxID=671175 RepID=UPI00259B8B62|nr:helix-turn-helix transcriptional regulator [uncultured Thermomonospora sp.]
MTSPFVRRRRLGAELRALREQRGLTADDVARVLCYSRMKISRIENGHNRPNLVEIMKILDYLEVTGEKYQQLVQIAREGAERGWWDEYGDAMGRRQRIYADIESGAATIREYHQTTLPALLQSPEFNRVLIELDKAQGTELTYVPERAMEARQRRQQVIFQPNGPSYEAILDEFVLRRLAAPASVMAHQFRYMVDVATRQPRLTIRILPLDARLAPGRLPRSAFTLYTFSDPADPPLAIAETSTADVIHIDPKEVASYEQLYDRLHRASLPPLESISMLARVAEELDEQEGSTT